MKPIFDEGLAQNPEPLSGEYQFKPLGVVLGAFEILSIAFSHGLAADEGG